MASILPFRGLRYNTKLSLDLTMVTAPPYDCISGDLQEELYERHPHNIVRLILGHQGKDDTDADNRYTRAARCLRQWQDSGVLIRETRPALYLYEQEFTADGQTRIRRGFIARVALEEFGSGDIHPHEQTFSGPKEDRLKLLQATRTNLSQVFALYPDETNEVMSAIDRRPLARPDLVVADDHGVINRMWIITHEETAAEVCSLMHRKPLFIADGHHRYTTALNYRKHLQSRGEDVSGHHPANFTSIMCVSMSDPGLVVFPTHRVLVNFPQVTAAQMQKALAEHFTWHEYSGAEAVSGRMEERLNESQGVAIGVYLRGDQSSYIAQLKDLSAMDRLATDHSPEWRRLDVSILHQLVLDRLLPEAFGPQKDLQTRYVHLASEAFDAVHEDQASVALLLKPPTVDDVRVIAGNGELMPQKSTYFYPKLLSGLIMNPLD
ncbi:MAG: DUF1015 domain-containing protein [Planctomycetes bacterium]|nr:DUF1015 domain-containing protein [Planctomycetota bacterium]